MLGVEDGGVLVPERCDPLHVSSDVHVPSCSSRRNHLENLEACIHRSEKIMETLLRTFDLDSSGHSLLDEPMIDDSYSYYDAQYSEREEHLYNKKKQNETSFLCSTPEPPTQRDSRYKGLEHSYFSTPLRSKYFPNITRSTLRRIMQSPSLRPRTAGTGDISDLSLAEVHQSAIDNTFGQGICASKQSTCHAISTGFPLTPPLTAHLGDSERFPSSYRSRSNSDIRRSPASVGNRSIPPEIQVRQTHNDISLSGPDAADVSFPESLNDKMSSFTLSSIESPTQFTIQRGHRAVPHTGTILTPSVLRDLRMVPREMSKEGSSTEEAPLTAAPFVVHNSPHTSGSAMKRGYRSLEGDIGCRSYSTQRQRCPTLEEEFRCLLLEQAVGDGALAEDLMGLVVRLDRLSESRKKLADLMSMKAARD